MKDKNPISPLPVQQEIVTILDKIDDVFGHIKKELDAKLAEGSPALAKDSPAKVLTLYAFNASGKTRLSTLFYKEDNKETVLCYNAFTEDFFTWDNNNYVLEINPKPSDPNEKIFNTIDEQGLEDQIIKNFQEFTGSELKPDFYFNKKNKITQITFTDPSSENSKNIKISRGEESVFVWSVFYTVLDAVIRSTTDSDNTGSDNTDSDNYEYVVIDDPVSSMDDKCIITIALKLVELISNSNDKLKFLITTHHALFFNVLFNTHEKNWNNKSYILSKQAEAEEYNLKRQKKDSPFAYHHVIISEINEAIDKNNLKKYHFNLFRALLEKTDNFLGYYKKKGEVWKELLPENENGQENKQSIDDMFGHIKKELDAQLEKGSPAKVLTLCAFNASGKTRLSTLFYKEDNKETVLCYNAFTEDFFTWDNKNYVLEINPKPSDPNEKIFNTIGEQGLEDQIIKNFQEFTGSELKPDFDFSKKQITFTDPSSENNENIKISRGEESVFVWSVFYTVLDTAIKALKEKPENRSTTDFNTIHYVVIDDPVSSIDDTRIITIALKLVELISNSNNQLKFLITTHHALFFNVLFNTREKNWNNESYILSKQAEAEEYNLKKQNKDSPFAYHHVIISKINEAIDKDNLKKYHFNLFRALLEKTANFLGYYKKKGEVWKELLPENENGQENKHRKAFIRTLNHYSHDRSSDLEPRYLHENDKEHFKKAFDSFLKEFKFFKKSNQLGPEDLTEDDKEHFKDAFDSFLKEFNFSKAEQGTGNND